MSCRFRFDQCRTFRQGTVSRQVLNRPQNVVLAVLSLRIEVGQAALQVVFVLLALVFLLCQMRFPPRRCERLWRALLREKIVKQLANFINSAHESNITVSIRSILEALFLVSPYSKAWIDRRQYWKLLVFVLQLVQLVVEAAADKKFLVRAHLSKLALVHDQDHISLLNS